MKTGVVKFFNDTKGYGFIKEDGSDNEIFVHASSVNGHITQGDKVSFDVMKGNGGVNAVNVNKI